jgi:hypothetical protein
LISVPHDAGMWGYGRQHVFLVEPVHPPRVFRRADILAPTVVRVRTDAMDRNDATGKVSVSLCGLVRHERAYSMSSAVPTGASRSTLRPMSSSVTGRTCFRVSLGTLRPVPDPPLSSVRGPMFVE